MNVTYPTPHRFTVDEYHRMGQIGVLQPDARLELIQGEILDMTPIGSQHASIVGRLIKLLVQQVGDHAFVNAQNPLWLSQRSELVPDVMLLKPRDDDYEQELPRPADVLLLIEVADTSLDHDRNTKLPLYASAKIPEVWIVNLRERVVEVYTNPTQKGYADLHRTVPGEILRPQALSSCSIPLQAVLK